MCGDVAGAPPRAWPHSRRAAATHRRLLFRRLLSRPAAPRSLPVNSGYGQRAGHKTRTPAARHQQADAGVTCRARRMTVAVMPPASTTTIPGLVPPCPAPACPAPRPATHKVNINRLFFHYLDHENHFPADDYTSRRE